MSSLQPTVATFTLERFAARGGLAGRTIDGWGLAFYDGADLRLYREPEPARDSLWLQYVQRRHLPARVLLSHIRHATRGAVSLANTQPFVREVGGRMHCFAHNGRLEALGPERARALRRYRPLGDTDSEVAACLLFERMAALWEEWQGPPPLAERAAEFGTFATEMRRLGPANFLYTDGVTLFAHGHRRTQPDGRVAPPGLWHLERHCAVDPDASLQAGVRLDSAAGAQDIVLVASVPLTDEAWQPLAEGQTLVVEHGALLTPA
jgi:glutamine amidotransferase